jgi:hypothetical protein
MLTFSMNNSKTFMEFSKEKIIKIVDKLGNAKLIP